MHWHKHQSALIRIAYSLIHLFDYMHCPKITISSKLDYAAVAYGKERIEFQTGFVMNATFEEIEGGLRR